MRRLLRTLVVAALVVACAPAIQPSAVPTDSVAPSLAPSPVPAPASEPPASAPPASEEPLPSSPPAEPSDPAPPSAPTGLGPGVIAKVVTDDLRVRTAPGVGGRSIRLEPLLQRGSTMYVVDGPVRRSGYAWFEVLFFAETLTAVGSGRDAEQVETGWVAAAGKDGEPWIDVARFDCPPTPATFTDLRAVAADPELAIACFGGTPITVEALLLDCDRAGEPADRGWCEMDTGSPAFRPRWFDRSLVFLADPDGPLREDTAMELHAAPRGSVPDPLPSGEVVAVTGQFDHPAARRCTVDHYFQTDQPSVYCRTVFAVTAIDAASP